MATAFCWAQDLSTPVNDVDVFRPEKRETKVQMVDSSKTNDVKLNVDIFADGFVGSYYILWDNVDLSEDIKKMMKHIDVDVVEHIIITGDSYFSFTDEGLI